MNENQIRLKLKNIKHFKGVFPRDRLPRKKYNKAAFIINTDGHTEPGEHWIAIIIVPKRVEYFDPFGLPPLHDDFMEFIKRQKKPLVYNLKTIQRISSVKCGKFCIAFIKSRCSGTTFIQFLRKFLKGNSEIIVEKLIK